MVSLIVLVRELTLGDSTHVVLEDNFGLLTSMRGSILLLGFTVILLRFSFMVLGLESIVKLYDGEQLAGLHSFVTTLL